MSEFREFVSSVGVPAAGFFAVLAMVYYGGRAVWSTLKPRLEKLFDRHFALVDSLIYRNEQQIIHDALMLTKRDACKLAEHHCNAIESLAGGDSVAVRQHVGTMREELRRMKESDGDRDSWP